MPRTHRYKNRNRLIGAGLAVVLAAAMIASTKFFTPEELAEALPKPFDPSAVAAELYQKATTDLAGGAKPLGEVVPAVQSDPKAAAETHGAVAPNESTWVFPVTATGAVTEASDQSLRLTVDGVPEQTPVLVPLGTAIQGTAVRDAMGFKFADAPGQTDYQYVGDEIKKLMQASVQQSVSEPASLQGKQVTVTGVISVQNNGAPQPRPKPVNVQPVSIEVQ
jgi:predicted lipoprotein